MYTQNLHVPRKDEKDTIYYANGIFSVVIILFPFYIAFNQLFYINS